MSAARPLGFDLDQAVADLVQRTRIDRGLPAKITDATVLDKVARILSAPSTRGGDR